MDTPQSESAPSVFREAHLRDYWKIVWQGRWTLLAVFFLVVGVTAVWTFLQTPIYRATTVLEVQPRARRLAAGQDVSGMGSGSYGWFAEERYHNTQVEIIQSRSVAKSVVDQLDLWSDPDFAEVEDPIQALRAQVRAVPRRETGLIEISITGADPEKITGWVNAVAHAYVDRNYDDARDNIRKAIDSIKVQMETLQGEFIQAESDVLAAFSDTGPFSSEEKVELIHERLKTYNGELNRVQIEVNHLDDKLERIRELRRGGGDLLSMPELAEDLTLRDLLADRVRLERDLESAKVEFKPGHPRYERTQSELNKIEQRIGERISVVQGRLQNEYQLALKQRGYLIKEIDDAEALLLEVARTKGSYNLTKSQSETKKQIYDLIARTLQEVQLGETMLENNVSILDESPVPRYPIKPRKRVNLAIGGVLGLFLGLAVAFFLDYLDNTFRTPEDIEKYLKLSVLGVIPRIDREGVSSPAIKEAYQSLRTSVIFSSKNRTRKVVLITSTGAQEGKSSTVANLGRTLAGAGERVLIIDCDLRRPTQHLIHRIDRESGLTNYLAAPIEASDWTPYVERREPGQSHLMTCGPVPPSPPELLGSERFLRMLGEMRERYDWILIDSPPAASLADSTLLASLADMMILVVKYNHTDRDLVTKTVHRLHSVKPNLAGAVLNQVDLSRAYNKDYYYAGYYYSGEKPDAESKAEPSLKSKVG